MPLRSLEQFLAEEIGLNCASLGSHAVALAAQQRSEFWGESIEDYCRRITTSIEERHALIEAIVVPETWFFRDGEPFVFLARFVVDDWLPKHPLEQLRILSVPCATGEEPYSIVMSLFNAGIAPDRFRVEAVDISRNFLHKARRGLYSHHSFRNADLTFRDRYFEPVGDQYQLIPSVRAQVHFSQGNLMQPEFLRESAPYPVVFCRNLIIYQHETARQHILKVLDQLLAREGLLFLGHAEMLSALLRKYTLVPHQGAFAFRKVHDSIPPAQHAPMPSSCKTPLPRAKAGAARSTSSLKPDHATKPAPALASLCRSSVTSLDLAQQLADRGDLAGAALVCDKVLATDPSNAQACFLLGLVREAEGQIPQAMEQLHKAIYLKADFYDAIMHLSLLKACSGDHLNAERLRQRAARIHQQERTPS
jgi:chemotaxis protein methyltransferase WspC